MDMFDDFHNFGSIKLEGGNKQKNIYCLFKSLSGKLIGALTSCPLLFARPINLSKERTKRFHVFEEVTFRYFLANFHFLNVWIT